MRSGPVLLVAALLLVPTSPAHADPPPPAGAPSLARQALNEARAPLMACYRNRLAVRADLAGDLVVRLDVAYSGMVLKVTVLEDTLRDPPLTRCVEGALETIRMPGSPSGGQATVPLHFDPRGGVGVGPRPATPAPEPSPAPGTAGPERTGPIPPPEAPTPPATGAATPATTPKAPSIPTANPARPTFSDNAVTTEPGALEIEAGGIYSPGTPGFTTLFKYGIAHHDDARIGWAENFGQAEGGTVQLFFKTTLKDPEPGVFGFALEPYLSVATPPAAQQNALGGILIATLPFGNRFELDANVVVQGSWIGPGRYAFEVDPVATLSVALGGGVGLFGEVYGLLPTASPQSAVADAGLTWTVQSNLVLDASVTRILTRSPVPWTLQAGLTYSFFLLGAPPAAR